MWLQFNEWLDNTILRDEYYHNQYPRFIMKLIYWTADILNKIDGY